MSMSISRSPSAKKRCIRNSWLLNPFFYYSIVWVVVLLINSMRISLAYPPMAAGTLWFIIATIVISFFLGIRFQRKALHFKKIENISGKPLVFFTGLLIAAFALEVIYSGNIPLLSILRRNAGAYQEFGIKSVSFLIAGLYLFNVSIHSVKLLFGDARYKRQNIVILGFMALRFILVFSRAMLLFAILIPALIYLSTIRITKFKVLLFFGVLLLGMFLFNILGNIRMGRAWNDNRYIFSVSAFNESYKWLEHFSWSLIYVDVSVGNLNNTIATYPPENDILGLFSQLLPDFLSKRILSGYSNDVPLVLEQMTTLTMYTGSYKYFGYFGMAMAYLELVLVILFMKKICRRRYEYLLPSLSALSIFSALTFFTNPIAFSGWSFFLIFFVIIRIVKPTPVRVSRTWDINIADKPVAK